MQWIWCFSSSLAGAPEQYAALLERARFRQNPIQLTSGLHTSICGVGIPVLHRLFSSTYRGYRTRSMFLLMH